MTKEVKTRDFECDTCGLRSDDLAIVGDLRAEIDRLARELEQTRQSSRREPYGPSQIWEYASSPDDNKPFFKER